MRKQLIEELVHEKDRLLGHVWAHAQLGMRKEAIIDCQKLIMLDGNDPQSYIEAGLAYEENGEIEKAVKYYKRAIKRFPGYSRAYVNLGHIFEKHKKRDDMAIVCYEKALELEPDNEWALNNIGAVLTKEGKRKEGLFYYEKAYEACRHKYGFVCGHIVHNLAWAFYRCKRYIKAWLIYSYLADEYPHNSDIFSDFGLVNYKIGKHDKAMDFFAKALSIEPDSRHYQRLYRVVKK